MYMQLSKCGRFDGKGGLSAKTIINVHRLLNNALKNAVIHGEMERNPCDLVVLPKYNRTVMRCLTIDEQRKILSAVKDSYYAPVFAFALQTGMRLGEVMGLTWNDVDFFNRVITVSHTLKRVNVFGEDTKTKLKFSTPKTCNSYRQIPLTDSLYNLLFEQHKRKSITTNQVFCNTKGELCGPRYIEQYFQNVCKRLNLKGVSFHTLRHSFATTCLQADIPIKTVSELLGHSTVQITMDLYQHVDLNTKKLALDKLEHFKDSCI